MANDKFNVNLLHFTSENVLCFDIKPNEYNLVEVIVDRNTRKIEFHVQKNGGESIIYSGDVMLDTLDRVSSTIDGRVEYILKRVEKSGILTGSLPAYNGVMTVCNTERYGSGSITVQLPEDA